MSRMVCVPAFKPATALTVSGGLTPSVTGKWIECGSAGGDFSLILENSGVSISLTVTYELGYMKDINVPAETITAITPTVGGAIADLTAVDVTITAKHASISTATTKWIRFNCANNAAAQTAVTTLYVVYQEV